MKNQIIIIAMLVVISSTACSHLLDKPVNKDDFPKVVEIIKEMEEYGDMKKRYIIDNFEGQLGFYEIGRQLGVADEAGMTFREVIEDLAMDYDVTLEEKIEKRRINQQLSEFANLINAKTFSIGRYEGYLVLDIDFNHSFDDDVLYIILGYKHTSKYDQVFFDERVRITDQVADDFKGIKQISLKEEYNSVARFMYSVVPVQASKKLRDELGEDEANEKVHREFLMDGLTIETLLVVLKDGTELSEQDEDWDYFEDN